MLLFARVLSERERDELESYLVSKWQIPEAQ
jgi:hypothetical protein